MAAEVIKAKLGLTGIPTYAELIKEIDREQIKTNDLRKIFDRNAWHFHDSPQGQALNTNNIHLADLQQMNFKKMAEEATARKEEETPNLDFEDITDLRDDTISNFEMSFDREAELREENERRVAEQAILSHSQDHYMANKGAYDALGATASAGIQDEEEKHIRLIGVEKVGFTIFKTFNQSSCYSRRDSKGLFIRRTCGTETHRCHNSRRRNINNTTNKKKAIQKVAHPKKSKANETKIDVESAAFEDDAIRQYHSRIMDERFHFQCLVDFMSLNPKGG